MNFIIEILLSIILILIIGLELVKIYFLKNDKNILLTIFISLILIGFGLYLSIKYGLILDYGNIDEIKNTRAKIIHNIAISSVLIGTGSLLIFFTEYLFWKIKKIISESKFQKKQS
jgi:uncharacterized membrane protein